MNLKNKYEQKGLRSGAITSYTFDWNPWKNALSKKRTDKDSWKSRTKILVLYSVHHKIILDSSEIVLSHFFVKMHFNLFPHILFFSHIDMDESDFSVKLLHYIMDYLSKLTKGPYMNYRVYHISHFYPRKKCFLIYD